MVTESDTVKESLAWSQQGKVDPPILQMKKLGPREYGVSVTYCCVTNFPKTERLKPQNHFTMPDSVG